jgi:hypothetical protein
VIEQRYVACAFGTRVDGVLELDVDDLLDFLGMPCHCVKNRPGLLEEHADLSLFSLVDG